MDESRINAFMNHFHIMTETLNQSQYLGALLLIGSGAILMLCLTRNYNNWAFRFSFLATGTAVAYLVFGLFIYRNLLIQGKILISASSQEKLILQLRISDFEQLWKYNAYIGFLGLFFLALALLFCRYKGKNKRPKGGKSGELSSQ